MTSILIIANLSNLLSFTDYPVSCLIKRNWSLECVSSCPHDSSGFLLPLSV